ncbi:MAG: squalene synthase HpnC, partial [Rhodospirillaceae bacterium]|nr:squalene synthase HpnC [Rhodospirillaceae bacterium]
SIETPSGKDADYENFPVGSFLLPKRLRPHVASFYEFARAADDIADSPDLPPEEKIRRLQGFETALNGEKGEDPAFHIANTMAASLNECGVSSRHCLDLLVAFKQDATKSRYDDWPDLMAYCHLSAAPVGRYLIDLHGGSKNGYWASDSLCAALQLINHLQDFGDDYRTLDRIYLPMDWIAEAGVDLADLAANSTTPDLRRVLDWTLIGVNQLLLDAAALPGGLYSTRLGLEASVIIQIARALSKKLAKNDPLSDRIELSNIELALCPVRGVAAGVWDRW